MQGKPIRTFLFIIVVMLIGFSVTIDAGQTQTECLDKSDPQALHAFCMSEMWWILRTYFQSFGEMFIDTVDDDWSVYATVMALLVLQYRPTCTTIYVDLGDGGMLCSDCVSRVFCNAESVAHH